MKRFTKLTALVLVLCLIAFAFAACGSPEKKLLGSWRDTTGSLGYDFYDDGRVILNYANFNIPIVNFTYDGDLNGTYTISKGDDGSNHLFITYTIFTQIDEEFTFTIKGDILTLTNVKSGNTYTLTRYVAGGEMPAELTGDSAAEVS